MTIRLSITRPIAKKSYPCDGCHTLNSSGLCERDMTPEQWQVVVAATADGSRIHQGRRYVKEVYKDGGISVYRFREDMYALCNELEVYDE